MCDSYNPPDTTQTDRVYEIDYSRPGVVIIFNNKKFTDPQAYSYRYGSEQDVSSLCKLFRGLNYEVLPPYLNKTEAKMRKAIDEYANHDYASYGCLIIFIMSHGDKSKIISSDSEEIDLNEFIAPLKTNISLKSKPKVFFIQACRRSNEMSADNPSSNIVYSRYYDHEHRLPKETDFLFSYSTLENHVSYSDEENGTWYIQMLCKAIQEEESKDIFAILTYTQSLISELFASFRKTDGTISVVKMTPTYESRLTKLFYIAKPKNVCIKNIFPNQNY